jgi:feruloyl-CoA synthase
MSDTPVATDFASDAGRLAPARVIRTFRADGGFVLRSPEPLEPYDRAVGVWLDRWAAETPDAIVFAERRSEGDLRHLTWGALRRHVGALGQRLLEPRFAPGRPVVIVSDNAIDHGLLMLAAQYIGRPVCSVSSAYTRLIRDRSRLREILRALGPAVVYASDAATYGPALLATGIDCPLLFSAGAADIRGAESFADWLQTDEQPAVRAAFEAIDPDHPAKFLLTSGSTGVPKVVINSHRMLCANQQQMLQVWRFLAEEKPDVVDWLPWSHTFGGNHNLNMVLRHGGTMTIDEGRPMPGMFEKTLANLRAVRPTLYFNVPRGYDLLATQLEDDRALARDFFSRLRVLFYAAAALPQSTWTRLERVAATVRDDPVWMTTSWGSTETAPAVTSAHWRLDRAGVIGLPLPGIDLRFVPSGAKLEMRVRGVSVFPGYRDAPELTQQAFDDEGFYRIGDAGRLLDPDRPEAGVVFDGRVAEDFKLATGAWVSVGTLRVKLVAALAPLIQDAVITGHDRDWIGALLFLSPAGAELSREALADALGQALARLLEEPGGSSHRVMRMLVCDSPPSIENGELTDKGYVNQRAVLVNRSEMVWLLYDEHPPEATGAGPTPRPLIIGSCPD